MGVGQGKLRYDLTAARWLAGARVSGPGMRAAPGLGAVRILPLLNYAAVSCRIRATVVLEVASG